MDVLDAVSLHSFLLQRKWIHISTQHMTRAEVMREMTEIRNIMMKSSTPLRSLRVGGPEEATKIFLELATAKSSTLSNFASNNVPRFLLWDFIRALNPAVVESLDLVLEPGSVYSLISVFEKLKSPFSSLRRFIVSIAPTELPTWDCFSHHLFLALAGVTSCLEHVNIDNFETADSVRWMDNKKLDDIVKLFHSNSGSIKSINFGSYADGRPLTNICDIFFKFAVPNYSPRTSLQQLAESCKSRLKVDLSCLSICKLSFWAGLSERYNPAEDSTFFDICHPQAAAVDWALVRAVESLAHVARHQKERNDFIIKTFDRLITEANDTELVISRETAAQSRFLANVAVIANLDLPPLEQPGYQDAIIERVKIFLGRQPYLLRSLTPTKEADEKSVRFLEKLFSKMSSFGRHDTIKSFLKDAFDFGPIAWDWISFPSMLAWALGQFDLKSSNEFFYRNTSGRSVVEYLLVDLKKQPQTAALELTLQAFVHRPEFVEQLMEALLSPNIDWTAVLTNVAIRKKISVALSPSSWKFLLLPPILPAVKESKQLFGLKTLIKEHHDNLVALGMGKSEPSLASKNQYVDATAQGIVKPTGAYSKDKTSFVMNVGSGTTADRKVSLVGVLTFLFFDERFTGRPTPDAIHNKGHRKTSEIQKVTLRSGSTSLGTGCSLCTF
jgi:hypothetical protein